jgi:rfaE bifunctional protein nucleotidyltransferase chain/domain
MSKKKTVFTNGCFDILHRGHIELLKFCKGMGKVVVGLNSDSSVSSLKGPTRPVFTERDRKFMLESCRYVDEVRIFEEDTPYNLIKVVKPDIIVKGSDYEIEDVVGNDLCKSVILFNYVDGYSTTQIIKNLSDR